MQKNIKTKKAIMDILMQTFTITKADVAEFYDDCQCLSKENGLFCEDCDFRAIIDCLCYRKILSQEVEEECVDDAEEFYITLELLYDIGGREGLVDYLNAMKNKTIRC